MLWASTSALGVFGGGGGTSKTATVVASDTGPAGWAVRYVRAYLAAGHGTEGGLTEFTPQPIDLQNVQPGSFKAVTAEAVDVALVGDDYWKVTVAAEVSGAPHSDGGSPAAAVIGSATTTTLPNSAYTPLGERCYRVAVKKTNGRLSSPTVPTGPVACPTPPPAPQTVFGAPAEPDPEDQVTKAVTQMLSVMLTGPPDIMGRYLAPGSTVAAITPPPFTMITVTGISKAQAADLHGSPQVLVFAGIEATDSAGRVAELGYTLQLVKPLNQWLVLLLYGAPPLEGKSP